MIVIQLKSEVPPRALKEGGGGGEQTALSTFGRPADRVTFYSVIS